MDENKSDGANLPKVVVFFDLPDHAPACARAQELKSGLGGAVAAGTLGVVESLEALAQAAQNMPQAQLVIVFPRPDIDIGHALKSGLTPRKALDGWRKRTEAILETQRGNRRRVTLVDDEALLADPKRTAQLLGTRIDLPKDEPVPGRASTLLRLIGQAILAQDIAASTLAAELVASSQSGEGEALSLQAAQDEFTALQTAIEREKQLTLEVEQYKAQIDDRQEEQDSVLAELLSLQETLRTVRDDAARKTAQVLQLGQGLESTEAQVRQLNEELKAQQVRHAEESHRQTSERDARLSELEARHAEETRKQATLIEESLSTLNERGLALEALEAEAATLRRTIQDKSGEVEILTRKLAESEDALRSREADLNARDAEITAFYGSKSYRMTAPLRWFRAALSGRR